MPDQDEDMSIDVTVFRALRILAKQEKGEPLTEEEKEIYALSVEIEGGGNLEAEMAAFGMSHETVRQAVRDLNVDDPTILQLLKRVTGD